MFVLKGTSLKVTWILSDSGAKSFSFVYYLEIMTKAARGFKDHLETSFTHAGKLQSVSVLLLEELVGYVHLYHCR